MGKFSLNREVARRELRDENRRTWVEPGLNVLLDGRWVEQNANGKATRWSTIMVRWKITLCNKKWISGYTVKLLKSKRREKSYLWCIHEVEGIEQDRKWGGSGTSFLKCECYPWSPLMYVKRRIGWVKSKVGNMRARKLWRTGWGTRDVNDS